MDSKVNETDVTRCFKCNLNFTSAKTLKVHQEDKHAQNIVKCFKCGLKFSNPEKFRVHWNNRHVTVAKTIARVKPLDKSIDAEVTISDDESKESDDNSKKSSRKTETKNISNARVIFSNRCNKCYKTFANAQFAKLHYQRVHMDWTIKCEVCQKSIKKNLYLKVHLRGHESKREITKERIIEIQKESINKRKERIRQSSTNKLKVDVEPKTATSCPDCSDMFISQRVMKRHWTKTHRKIDDLGVVPNKREKNDPGVPSACSECGKMFSTDGRMRIHYYQAHIKNISGSTSRKRKRKQFEIDENEVLKEKSFPIVKSFSDLRSKIPDIDFESNICPVCKKVFSDNKKALKHFQIVHRKTGAVKCPYPQCFIRCSQVPILRTHFAKCHPKAILPKKFQIVRRLKHHKTAQEKENEPHPKGFVLFSVNTDEMDIVIYWKCLQKCARKM